MRKDADVEAFGSANQAVQQAAGDARPPRATEVVADVQLRHVALTGEA